RPPSIGAFQSLMHAKNLNGSIHHFQRDGVLVYCNGVFHHIPPQAREAAVAYVARALRPGGLWAFWENNPWNPGTRYAMHRIPFDRDAIPLTPPEARRLLQAGRVRDLQTHCL